MQFFHQMLAEFEETYMDQAMILTEKMNNPELSGQARTLVRGIISQIYRKSIDKWEDLKATAMQENFFSEMLHNLKRLVFDSRINNKVLTKEIF